MIEVKVKLFATLRREYPDLGIGEAMSVAVPDDANIADLVERLNLPDDQVKVVFVNGTVRRRDFRLSEGDEVGIFPPVGGG